MKKSLAICLLFFFAFFSLQAGKSQGVVEEFNKVEEYNKNVKLSDATKKATLEKNLLSAVKYTLHHRYLEYKEITKDLNADTMLYEPQKGTYTVYVKFKKYLFFYSFKMDPEIYLQTPENEVFYLRPENLDDPHKENTSAPDGKSGK
ncbi:LIC11625 family surface-exposed protein [Leptospira noguchii]|uniref:Lipoprotein n=1 Tax=Leptospira noguchii serovar Panama str. CZ214 TaxID=1001595 RepID=T0FLE2_9LEPT|nr:hypothetical protein [Leptospira noguchii]EQA70385.1 hypothetical protein LEP1GSC059_0586 [Leptospira noguchii serovar Panama str. CZ214]